MAKPGFAPGLLRGFVLAVAAVVGGSCIDVNSGNVIVLSTSADAPVAQYDLQVYDTASGQLLEDTMWTPTSKNLKDQSVRIGLNVQAKKNYTVVIYGCAPATDGTSGCPLDHTHAIPASATQLFFAQHVQVDGETDVNAKLLTVPLGDDSDLDWWPDATDWPNHIPDAATMYAGKTDLLDCADKQVMTCDMMPSSVQPGDVHPFSSATKCGTNVDYQCNGTCTGACADSDNDGDPDGTDCDKMNPKIHHPITDPTSPHYDPFPESANCCGYSLGKTGSDATMDFTSATLPGGGMLCHPGTCGTGVDYNCDGVAIDCKADKDCDTFTASATQPSSCSAPANMPPGNDCNDCDNNINPGASEICGDGIDNNCNGLTDETCVNCDLDGDGYQRSDASGGCPNSKTDKHPGMIDCDDEDAGVFPGSLQVAVPAPISKTCGGAAGSSTACLIVAALRGVCKGLPNTGQQDVSCDGTKGEGCPTATCDADRDGFVDQAQASTCDPNNMFPHDCNDSDLHVFPGAPEKCGDNIDQNCNGLGDDACGTDADGDHYDNSVDCDDNDANTHPWATELCDGKDNDCDGLTDEGNPDGQGNPMGSATAGDATKCNDSGVGLCAQLTGNCVCSVSDISGLHFDATKRTACPGETAAIDTGAQKSAPAPRCYFATQPQPQSCNPQAPVDDDCDGRTDAPDGKNLDPNLLGHPCWPAAQGPCAPTMGGNIVACDSTKVNCFSAAGDPVNPWLVCDSTAICPTPEKCNGLDDNCDGQVPLVEQDVDKDGYIACGFTDATYQTQFMDTRACESKLASGIVGCGDCDDGNTAVHPGLPDICDALDNDCSTATADGASTCPGPAPAMICCDMPMSMSGPVGCKDPTKDNNNCGGCNIVCAGMNATEACMSSLCVVKSCATGFADCDKVAQNGCEISTATDVANCGGCAMPCSTMNIAVACSGGSCTGTCTSPYLDCNNNKRTDGCEINPLNDPLNCGACGNKCSTTGGGGACVNGQCGCTKTADCATNQTCINSVCISGVGGPCQMDNQCTTNSCCSTICVDETTDVNNCGSCGNVCGVSTAGKKCVSGVCGCNMLSDCAANTSNACTGNQCLCNSGPACDPTTQKCTTNGCKLAPGQQCSQGSDCASGVCDQSQTAGVKYCTSANMPCGKCQVVTNTGSCVNATANTDPRTDCSNASLCEGLCDGTGKCLAAAAGTACGTAMCNNMSCFGQCTSGGQTGFCDGTTVGSCPGSVACPSHLICGGTTGCLSVCNHDADCVAGFYCKTPGSASCTMKGGAGASCSANNQCTTDICAGGKCVTCDSGGLANLQCSATSALCSNNACGGCSNGSGGDTDCRNARLGNNSNSTHHCTCGSDGDCSNPRAGTCSSGVCVCSAAGAICADGQLCTSSGCKWDAGWACIQGSDCMSGTCTSGTCAKSSKGTTCMTNSDCTSGTCSSFVCG